MCIIACSNIKDQFRFYKFKRDLFEGFDSIRGTNKILYRVKELNCDPYGFHNILYKDNKTVYNNLAVEKLNWKNKYKKLNANMLSPEIFVIPEKEINKYEKLGSNYSIQIKYVDNSREKIKISQMESNLLPLKDY